MYIKLCAFLLLCLIPPALQAQQPNWQQEAVRKFPELAVPGSPLNTRFREEYDRRRSVSPEFFKAPDWPVTLAKECASELAGAKVPPKPKTTAPANPEPADGLNTKEFPVPEQRLLTPNVLQNWRAYLEACRIPFPPGASVRYDPTKNIITVRNTEENLDLVKAVCEEMQRDAGTNKLNLAYYETSQADAIKLAVLLSANDEKGDIPPENLEQAKQWLERSKDAKKLLVKTGEYLPEQRYVERAKAGTGESVLEFETVPSNGTHYGPALVVNMVAKYPNGESPVHWMTTTALVPLGSSAVYLTQGEQVPSGKQYVVVFNFADSSIPSNKEKAGSGPSDKLRPRFAVTAYEFPSAASKHLEELMKAGADFDEAASAYLEKQGGAKRLLSISRPFELEQITAEHLIQGREQFVLTFKPNVLEGAQQATVDFKVTYGTERQTYFQTEVKGGKVPLGRKVLFWTPGYHHGDKGYAVAVESLFKPAP